MAHHAAQVRLEHRLAKRVLGLGRIGDLEPGHREQQAQLRIDRQLRDRAERGLLGHQHAALLVGDAPLQPGDRSEDQQHGRARAGGEQQAPLAAHTAEELPLQAELALADELDLVRGQLVGALAAPAPRFLELAPAQQAGRLLARRFPFGDIGAQLLPPQQELLVLGEPGAQPRPVADQPLVRDFNGVLSRRRVPAGHHQARVGERLDDDPVALAELVDRRTLADILRAAGSAGHPQAREHAAREQLLVRAEAGEELFGALVDGAVHAADRVVGGVGQQPVLPPRPELGQRELEQRKAPRLAAHVVEDALDEALLELDRDAARGLHDRALQLVALHGPEIDDAALEVLAQLPAEGDGRRVERRAQGDEDRDRRALDGAEQPADERSPLGLGRLVEDLLELVHDEQQPVGAARLLDHPRDHAVERHLAGGEPLAELVAFGEPIGLGEIGLERRDERRRELVERPVPRNERHHVPGRAGRMLHAQLRNQAGLHDRGLAAARRADHRHELVAPGRLEQPLHVAFAAEEKRAVLLAEGAHAAVRAQRELRLRALRRAASARRARERVDHLRVGGIAAQVDPGVEEQEPRRRIGAGEQHRDHGKAQTVPFRAHLALEGEADLALLPQADAVRSEEHHHRGRALQPLLERLRPGHAGDEVVAIEKRRDAARGEELAHLQHRFPVGAVVADENFARRRERRARGAAGGERGIDGGGLRAG